ncbi:MAG: DNA mismatch repair endonuclease MutL [Candidatus Dormibacteria bacterium]
MIAAAPILRLPQVVADAIAAGEVIERPASVLKELVENALDAGATRIDIAIEGGGLVRIVVADDGTGMAADDLELAVERHATSKIAAAEDITRVRTLGFRGEALASIAAVSELRLTTRTRGSTGGASLHVRNGEVLSRTVVASGPGTRAEVCELFAASPVRLRFLRSVATEGSAAVRVAADLAITHPRVAFTCTNDGRLVLRTAGGTLREAIRAVVGTRAERELLDLDAPGPIAVAGAISSPHAHRASRSGLVLIVNHRLVRNRALLAAVDESYRGLIPGGRHGYGVVTVEISGEAVDVNVHPAKREVRFSDEHAVFSAVQRACWAALRTAPALGADRLVPAGFANGSLEVHDGGAELIGRPASPTFEERSGADAWRGAPAGNDSFTPTPSPAQVLAPMEALGQAGSGFVIAAAGETVVLVDPHAAHEKVLYTELLARWHQAIPEAAGSQLLLMPVVVECGPDRASRVADEHDFFSRCGFMIEQFGPGAVRCTAVPMTAATANPEVLVAELIERLDERDGGTDERRHRLAALVACHAAVRFGDRLDVRAQQRLLDQLVATPGGTTCPHGRPSVLVLDDAALRRAFRRPPR